MPWMMAAYVAFSVSISVSVAHAAGMGAAACALVASCLAVVAAGALKFAVFWAAGAQRLVVSLVAVVLLVVAYALSKGFSVTLFGHVSSGELWGAIGAVIGFVAVDKRVATELNRE